MSRERPDREPSGPDPGDVDRQDAVRELGRRLAIWLVPLLLVGGLITALGIPWWISAIAVVVTLVVLVFELEI